MPGRDQRVWRIIFGAAAAYNISFATWTVLFPHAFFDLFDLGASNHPWVWSCLGMVIGVYGIGYAHVSWKPDDGDLLVWLGLLGKVLGPLGWLWTVRQGEIPPQTFPLILSNDLIWWFPFIAYLLRRSSARRSTIAMLCGLFHVVGCVALIAVRHGTEGEPDIEARLLFLRSAMFSWTLCWLTWVLASLSWLAFVLAWASTLRAYGAPRSFISLACAICAVGLGFDLTSETILIVVLTDSQRTASEITLWARWSANLGPGVANGLYCIAGCLLSLASWRCEFQRGKLALLAAAVWTSGFGLSAATFAHHGPQMVVFGSALMVLFIPWAFLTGMSLRAARKI